MAATEDLIPDFDDFERYHSGEMQAAEQRLLEGRMLAEPLVAEAYEGFLAWRAQHADIAGVRTDLYKRLRTREARTRAVPLWAYASAASVLLVLFVCWAVFLNNQKVDLKKQTIAEIPKAVPLSAPEQAPAPATVQPHTQLESAASAHVKPEASVPATHVPKSAGQVANASKHPETGLAETGLADIVVPQETTDVASGDSFGAETLVVQVPPQPAKPLQVTGSMQSLGKSKAASVRMEQSSLNNASKDAAKLDTQQLEEVKVLSQQAVAMKKSAAPMVVPTDAPAPVPADGWPSYHAYLEKHTASAPLEGQITVTFVVGTLGTLSGFVAKGPEELQKEAIRIIREGPAWVPARAKGQSVTSMAEIRLQFRQAP